MRTGDHVKHLPTGEEWLVAFVEDGRLCACGWPCSLVPVADCELVKACTDIESNSLLVEMSNMNDCSDPRCTYAKRVLAREDA